MWLFLHFIRYVILLRYVMLFYILFIILRHKMNVVIDNITCVSVIYLN